MGKSGQLGDIVFIHTLSLSVSFCFLFELFFHIMFLFSQEKTSEMSNTIEK